MFWFADETGTSTKMQPPFVESLALLYPNVKQIDTAKGGDGVSYYSASFSVESTPVEILSFYVEAMSQNGWIPVTDITNFNPSRVNTIYFKNEQEASYCPNPYSVQLLIGVQIKGRTELELIQQCHMIR